MQPRVATRFAGGRIVEHIMGARVYSATVNGPSHPRKILNWRCLVPYAVLAIPVLLVFGGYLFGPGEKVATHLRFDVPSYYAAVRSFGFGEIARGHVPLWNPHTFAGTPFVAAFQPALYYPLNLHYLVLPLTRSLNLEMALHVYLLGAFMYAWARGRGLSTVAALFAALVVQFSGPYYLNVLAGHLAYLCALAWTPLAFLAVDNAVSKGRTPWSVVGALALTMAILAGHPQAVFCTVVVLAPYAVIAAIRAPHRLRSIGHTAVIFGAPLVLSAPQLCPAIAITPETIRANGLLPPLASSVSLPPENLLTLFVPSLFGDGVLGRYTGRWFFWEVCVFVGLAACSLAIYAIVVSKRRERFLWLGLAVFATLIALGRYTPFYSVWYHVPMVDSFRCPARQSFQAILFLALLSGLGFDTLVKQPRSATWWAIGCGTLCAALIGIAAYLHYGGDNATAFWSSVLERIEIPGETRREVEALKIRKITAHTANSFAVAGTTAGILALLYALTRKHPKFAYGVVAVGMIEILAFAFAYRMQADMSKRTKPELLAALQPAQKDARIFDMAMSNYPLLTGLNDMWGYDSTALMRYAQLIAYTQNTRVEYEMTEFTFKWFHPGYAMLRCEYIVDSGGAGAIVRRFDNPAPRAILIDEYAVITDMEERLRLLADPAFDPRVRVLLESEPSPKPQKGSGQGSIKITDESTDAYTVEVATPRSALLLLTDSYAKDWRASSVNSQVDYTILPANHCLSAIPLEAGTHQIHFEYDPLAAKWGKVGGLAASCMMFMFGLLAIRRRKPGTT